MSQLCELSYLKQRHQLIQGLHDSVTPRTSHWGYQFDSSLHSKCVRIPFVMAQPLEKLSLASVQFSVGRSHIKATTESPSKEVQSQQMESNRRLCTFQGGAEPSLFKRNLKLRTKTATHLVQFCNKDYAK